MSFRRRVGSIPCPTRSQSTRALSPTRKPPWQKENSNSVYVEPWVRAGRDSSVDSATPIPNWIVTSRSMSAWKRRMIRMPVYAEVVYRPEGRIGNGLFRPVLREYEIVPGPFRRAQERQLPASDVLIGIVGGRIQLRSQRLGKRV